MNDFPFDLICINEIVQFYLSSFQQDGNPLPHFIAIFTFLQNIIIIFIIIISFSYRWMLVKRIRCVYAQHAILQHLQNKKHSKTEIETWNTKPSPGVFHFFLNVVNAFIFIFVSSYIWFYEQNFTNLQKPADDNIIFKLFE